MKTLNFIIATALLLVAAQRHSFAGSATWDQNPTSSDWNTATNWTPPTVPNGVSDTATFETSDVTKIAISSTIRLASCIFDQGASGFRITSDDSGELTFDGAGVINNSTIRRASSSSWTVKTFPLSTRPRSQAWFGLS